MSPHITGSSACSNGKFYCKNKGHEEQILDASFVDDGICDCCDGTDELKGCTNTCLEKSAGALLSLQQKVSSYSHLLNKKAGYVSQAAERRKHWASRTHTIDTDINAKISLIETAKGDSACLHLLKNQLVRALASQCL